MLSAAILAGGRATRFGGQDKSALVVDGRTIFDRQVTELSKIAGEILSHLSAAMSPQAKEAYELLQRAWTVLLDVYFEVREVGQCLLRRDPKRDEWFPSLFARVRGK